MELMCALSVGVRKTDAYTQHAHQKLNDTFTVKKPSNDSVNAEI
jgi:hypothetical protein